MTYRNKTSTKTSRFKTPNWCSQQTSSNLEIEYISDYLSSTNSSRVNGALALKENTLNRVLVHTNQEPVLVIPSEALWCPGRVNMPSLETLPTPPGLTANVYSNAASKFYEGLSNMKVNAAQVFAERQKTADLIANNARRIAQLYLSLKKGRNPFTGKGCNGAHASQLWLEHVYGWTPLVSDVYGAINLHKTNPPPFHYSAKSSQTYSMKKKASVNYAGFTKVESEFDVSGSYRVKIKADVTVIDPVAAFATTLGLTNPAVLVWELLPYSFVVDWFVPVGTFLSSLTATAGLKLTNTSTTTGMVGFCYTNTPKLVGYSSNTGRLTASGGARSHKFVTVNRVLTIPSVPLPRMKSPVSVTHALNAIALLGASFGRR